MCSPWGKPVSADGLSRKLGLWSTTQNPPQALIVQCRMKGIWMWKGYIKIMQTYCVSA